MRGFHHSVEHKIRYFYQNTLLKLIKMSEIMMIHLFTYKSRLTQFPQIEHRAACRKMD